MHYGWKCSYFYSYYLTSFEICVQFFRRISYNLQTRSKWCHKIVFFNCCRSRLCGTSIFHTLISAYKSYRWRNIIMMTPFFCILQTRIDFQVLVSNIYCYDWITSKLLHIEHVFLPKAKVSQFWKLQGIWLLLRYVSNFFVRFWTNYRPDQNDVIK